MEILGIGPTELIFIILIAIIVLGPKEMQNAGRTVGRWLNRLVNSEGWMYMKDATQTLRSLPNKWMREANMEMWEAQQDIRRAMDPRSGKLSSQRSQQRQSQPASDSAENSILPPSSDSSPSATDEKPSSQSDTHE
jgi:hypothetical protein